MELNGTHQHVVYADWGQAGSIHRKSMFMSHQNSSIKLAHKPFENVGSSIFGNDRNNQNFGHEGMERGNATII
jgi:hypothetical protein